MWVSQVFSRAGYRYYGGNACDMYRSWCHSNNRSQLKAGMIVSVDKHPGTRLGRIYGHVAIYIGDGKVMQNVGKITTDSLDHWMRVYGVWGNTKWGWIGNKRLA